MRRTLTGILPLLTIGALGCPVYDLPKAEDDESDYIPETTETDYGEPVSCSYQWNRLIDSEFDIDAVCLSGTQTTAPFLNPVIDVPCGTEDVPRTTVPAEQYDEASTGDDYLVQSSGNPLCLADDPLNFVDSWRGGGGLWELRFEPEAFSTCADYTVDHIEYVVLDTSDPFNIHQRLEGSLNGVACPYIDQISAFAPMPNLPGGLGGPPSSPGTCTPGSATFDLVARDTEVGTDGQRAIQLTPIAAEPAPFPERAWLRRVVIEDWGDVDNLHFATTAGPLRQKGSDVWGGAKVAGASVKNFAPGKVAMGSMFATAGAPLGADVDLPRVELSWTCQSDPDAPHYSTPVAQGYVGQLPGLLGIDHRMNLWVEWESQRALLAPEGRYGDHVRADLTPTGPNTATLEGELPIYDATFSAAVTRTGPTLTLSDLTLTVAGLGIPVPTITMQRIDGS